MDCPLFTLHVGLVKQKWPSYCWKQVRHNMFVCVDGYGWRELCFYLFDFEFFDRAVCQFCFPELHVHINIYIMVNSAAGCLTNSTGSI